jgi:hypothetical protein
MVLKGVMLAELEHSLDKRPSNAFAEILVPLGGLYNVLSTCFSVPIGLNDELGGVSACVQILQGLESLR